MANQPDMPTVVSSSYGFGGSGGGGSGSGMQMFNMMGQPSLDAAAGAWSDPETKKVTYSLQRSLLKHAEDKQFPSRLGQPEDFPMAASTTRIVEVYIADPNDNLPLESRLLYKGDKKLTDASDQELYFELSMKEMLDKHNEVRVKTLDKAQSAKFGRDMFLEAAKIRDLKMAVVTVAQF